MTVFYLALGALWLALGISAGILPSILTGGLLTVAGILTRTGPAVVLHSDQIDTRNLLGMTVKRHRLTADNYRVENNKIYVDGKRRVSLRNLDPDEDTVREYLASHLSKTTPSR